MNRELKSIDEICDKFEASLATDSPLKIVDLVQQADDELQIRLLRELIPLERELVSPLIAASKLIEYREKLPQYAAIIDELSEQETQAPRSKQSNARHIGPYKLLQEIGEGGMGSVWMAEQEHPVRRRVALKVIKEGLGTSEIIARFEAERQAMAMMEHPNIAKILDAGTTESGQPFFAMELVKGVPLTQYCDAHELSLRERLEIFEDVCLGIHHAHQKGIIHRDLKPGNILVTEYNGAPVPKIIDFGLAKALEVNTKLTDKTMFTEFGQVIGTLVYMSPEQAGLDSLDIDTRSDVYTLGVILYELLTGTTPLQSSEFAEKALLQILALIREQHSPKPSNRIETTSQKQLETVVRKRRTNQNRLSHLLAGDLDWIALKAIEKDRTRRYESAAAFANDIRNFLANDPVVARPPSKRYRVRKFIAKNRLFVSAVLLVAATLLAGIATSSWFAYKASISAVAEKKQRLIADRKSKEASTEAKLAREAESAAKSSAEAAIQSERQTQSILRIVKNAFQIVNPDRGGKATTDAKSILAAAQSLMNVEDLAEETKGELLRMLTTCYLGIGEYAEAEKTGTLAVEIRQRIFGNGDERTIDSLNDLGAAYSNMFEYEAALPYLELAKKSADELLGPKSKLSLKIADNLAGAYMGAGQTEKGLQLYEANRRDMERELGSSDPATIKMMANLAVTYFQQGKVKKSVALLEDAHETSIDILGAGDAETLRIANNLATAYMADGQVQKAIKIQEGVWEARKKLLGPSDPRTLSAQNNLASSYIQSGQTEDALDLFTSVLERQKAVDGAEHQRTLRTMANTATALIQMNRFDDGMSMLDNAIAAQQRTLGPDHSDVYKSKHLKAIALAGKGDIAKSLILFNEIFHASKRGILLEGSLANEVANQRPQVMEEAIKMLHESIHNKNNEAATELAQSIPIQIDSVFLRVVEDIVKLNERIGKGAESIRHIQRWVSLTRSSDQSPSAKTHNNAEAVNDLSNTIKEHQEASERETETMDRVELQSRMVTQFLELMDSLSQTGKDQ